MSALYLFQWAAGFKAAKCVFLLRLVVRSVYGRLTMACERSPSNGCILVVFWCVAGLTWTSYARRMDGVRTLIVCAPQWTERNAK